MTDSKPTRLGGVVASPLFGVAEVLRPAEGIHRRGAGGGTDVWLTPPELLAELGPFDLDPCAASEPRPWPTAVRHLTAAEDGLRHVWSGRVWLNPPYSDSLVWLARLAEHGTGTALVFARTDTRAFHEFVFGRAAGLLFLRGRLSFCRPDGSRGHAGRAGAPSVLVAYGVADADRLVAAAGVLGGRFVGLT